MGSSKNAIAHRPQFIWGQLNEAFVTNVYNVDVNMYFADTPRLVLSKRMSSGHIKPKKNITPQGKKHDHALKDFQSNSFH